MANEIELMVSIRRQGENGIKRKGDVITCRLSGGKWGNTEKKVHQVVSWPAENASLEEKRAATLLIAILNRKEQWGEKNPRVDYPFSEVIQEEIEDEDGNKILDDNGAPTTRTVMTNRSILNFNFESLTEQQINDILNTDVEATEITSENLQVAIEEKGIDKRSPSDRGLKLHRGITSANPVLHAETAKRRDETTDIQEFLSRKVAPIDSWK